MVSHSTLRRLLVASVSATLILSACGGNDDDNGSTGASSSSRSSSQRRSSASSRRSSASNTSSASSRRFSFFQRGSSSATSQDGLATSSRAAVTTSSAAGGAPSQAGAIRLFADVDRSEVRAGDEVTFTISVRNASQAAVRNAQVVFSFATSQLSVVDANGSIQSDHVLWTIDSMSADERRTFVLRARLAQNLPTGTVVRGNVIAIRDAAVEPNTVTAEVRITDASVPLPPTGPLDGMRPLEDASRFLRPYKK